MTTILEKKDRIIDSIKHYLINNTVNYETTVFKEECFTSIYLNKEELAKEDSIIYVLPVSKKDPTVEEISIAMVDRFLKYDKKLGFKPKNLDELSRLFHRELLIESINIYTLNFDIKKINKRLGLTEKGINLFFEENKKSINIEEDADLVVSVFREIAYSLIEADKLIVLPSLYSVYQEAKKEKVMNFVEDRFGKIKKNRFYSLVFGM